MNIDQAIEHFGSQSALARALGIEPPSVAEWKANGRIPPLRQFQIESVTGGKLKADQPQQSAA
jgi:DNA-binding transcriptional regulator YdaS (Cro superfamily)